MRTSPTDYSTPRKVKILATTGPAMDSPECIRTMIKHGLNEFRFNFSHADIQEHRPVLERVRRVSRELGQSVACLADLPGPKIRVGQLKQDPIYLQPNSRVSLYPSERTPAEQDSDRIPLPIEYSRLLEDLSSGKHLYINDGRVVVEVDEVDSDRLNGEVKEGGTV